MESELRVQLEKIRRKIEDYEEKCYDKEYEEDWKKILNELNELKIKVYKEKMFSDNEEFSEVKTEDIKFMLIAYYQSEMIQKFQVNRKNVLEFGLKFYDEFYKLLKSYNYLTKEQIDYYKKMTKKDNDSDDKNKKPDFNQMAQERQTKIQMYKYKKALSEKLKKIEKEQNYDDNREYWTEYLNLCIVKMLENLKMVNMEIDSINYLEKMKKENNNVNNNDSNKNKPNEPKKKMEILQIKSPEDIYKLDPNNKLVQNLNFITTSDNCNCPECFKMTSVVQTLDDTIINQLPENVRKKILSNPNPTQMTMEEFAEMQMKDMKERKEKEEEYKKNKSDDDSDKEEVSDKKTYKAREWDDWKDEHPKGSGNTMGK